VNTNHDTLLVTFTIGPDFVNVGQAHTLTLLPPFQNHYTRADAFQTVTDAGIFAGVERNISDRFAMQLGVAGYAVDTEITPRGTVWQFANPAFENLSYFYNIDHTRLMATTKLLTTVANYHSLHPYLTGEIGAAFNNANGYQEIPLEGNATGSTPFNRHKNNSFAWGIGAGVDYNLNQSIRLGLGYQFSDLGSASLGPNPSALTNQTLSIPHIYANQLRFQLTILV